MQSRIIITYPNQTTKLTIPKSLITPKPPISKEPNMCEFNIILNGKILFKDVIQVKTENSTVTAKNVLGETKQFKNCLITEVDVNTTKLVLTPTKP